MKKKKHHSEAGTILKRTVQSILLQNRFDTNSLFKGKGSINCLLVLYANQCVRVWTVELQKIGPWFTFSSLVLSNNRGFGFSFTFFLSLSLSFQVLLSSYLYFDYYFSVPVSVSFSLYICFAISFYFLSVSMSLCLCQPQ